MKESCICADLRLAARKATAVYDDALAPVGVNVAQYSMLRKIEIAGSVSFTELGRQTGLERSTVGRNCKVLERLGLIEPSPGDDAREMCVALTDAGVEALRAAGPLWAKAQRKMDSVLGQGGGDQLRALLQRL